MSIYVPKYDTAAYATSMTNIHLVALSEPFLNNSYWQSSWRII